MALQSIFKKAYWTLAVGGLLYVLFLLALTNSTIQRQSVSLIYVLNAQADIYSSALYAHKVNPTLWQDINDVEQFGFLSKTCTNHQYDVH